MWGAAAGGRLPPGAATSRKDGKDGDWACERRREWAASRRPRSVGAAGPWERDPQVGLFRTCVRTGGNPSEQPSSHAPPDSRVVQSLGEARPWKFLWRACGLSASCAEKQQQCASPPWCSSAGLRQCPPARRCRQDLVCGPTPQSLAVSGLSPHPRGECQWGLQTSPENECLTAETLGPVFSAQGVTVNGKISYLCEGACPHVGKAVKDKCILN